MKIQGTTKDRRRKLSDTQRKEIKENVMNLSKRKLASQYEVSRRTIQFILDPDKHSQNLQRRFERGGSKIYYNKGKHRVYMQNHRAYKKELKSKDDEE